MGVCQDAHKAQSYLSDTLLVQVMIRQGEKKSTSALHFQRADVLIWVRNLLIACKGNYTQSPMQVNRLLLHYGVADEPSVA